MRAGGEGEAREALERLRQGIEEVDRELVGALARRVSLAQELGELKEELGLPTLDPAREAAVVRRAGALAREAGLDPESVRNLYWLVIGMTRRAQGREP